MSPKNKVAVITDFGLQDPYVGVMKAQIFRFVDEVEFIDITHYVPQFNIKAATFIFSYALRWLPEDTHFLIVVDPGVGSNRRAITAVKDKRFFVAPDNGVLSPILDDADVYAIENIKPESSTFHGRDIFAPALGMLLQGKPPEELGPRVSDPIKIRLPKPEIEEGWIRGEIIYIDHFGNLVTNIPRELVRSGKKVIFKGVQIPLVNTYFDVDKGQALVIIDSYDMLEISVREGSAKEKFGAEVGDIVQFER